MRLKDWDTEERPREKLLLKGPGALGNAELLAIFIGSGVPGANAVSGNWGGGTWRRPRPGSPR